MYARIARISFWAGRGPSNPSKNTNVTIFLCQTSKIIATEKKIKQIKFSFKIIPLPLGVIPDLALGLATQ